MGVKIRWLAAVLATTACGGAPSPAPPAPPTSAPVAAPAPPAPPAPPTSAVAAPAPSLVELQLKSLREYVRAFNKHDAKAIAALYAEDALFVERGEFVSAGGGSIEANYKEHFDAFPDATTAITRSWHRGATVVFEYVESGTHTGPHRAHAPTGKKFGYVGASWLEFAPDGRVTKDTTYSDELTKEVQLGWAPGALAKMKVRPVALVPPATQTWEVHQVTSHDDKTKAAAVKRSLYSELSLRSDKEFLGAFSDDVALMPYDEPADAKGQKEAAAMFKEWTRSFSNGTVEATEGWAIDGHFVVLGTYTGKHVGAWGPVPATNKTFTTHFLDVAKVGKDDKVERVWSYANNYELLKQLGYRKTEVVVGGAKK